MRNRGPSPLVPSLMVGVLSLIIFGPSLLYLSEYILPLFQGGDEEGGLVASFAILILPIILLVLIHLLTICFPVRNNRAGNLQIGSSGYDDGFGLGTLLLVVLFFILYNVMWAILLVLQYAYACGVNYVWRLFSCTNDDVGFFLLHSLCLHVKYKILVLIDSSQFRKCYYLRPARYFENQFKKKSTVLDRAQSKANEFEYGNSSKKELFS